MIFMKLYLKRRVMLKIIKKFILVIHFIFFFSSPINAAENIIIKGNKNIATDTIISLAPKNINNLSPILINDFQKKLFETGFFKNVLIKVVDRKILVEIVENPLVNFFYIEGIKKNSMKDNLLDLVKIKENFVFQPYLINEDKKNIINYLSSLGYLNSNIDFQIIQIENNKVNIFYKININNKFKINRIFFVGNKYFDSSTLKDVVYSSEHGWWKFLSTSTTPSENSINYDISRLKKFYLNKGFYDVQITSQSVKIINNSKANIVYSINAGEKYKINNVSLIDQSKSLTEKNLIFLKEKCTKLIDTDYSLSSLQEINNFINTYLVNSNFDLNINTSISKNLSNKLSVSFVITENVNKKIIDKIIIKGNNITDDFVIRNGLSFSEGDYLNITKLSKSVTSLEGKGIFKKVESEVVNKDFDFVDLLVKVEEQPTGEISAGAGAGTDGATISGGINEKNFLGKGLFVNSNINIGTQKIFGKVSYTNPDFRNTNNSFNLNVFVENNDYDNASYENKIMGTSTSLNYELYDKLYLNPGISIDYDSLKANLDASSLVKKREGDFFTSKLFYNLSKNTKNKEFQTTDGYVFGVGQTLSVLSDIPYINNRIYGSYYDEFIDKYIGSIKYKIETINAFQNKNIKFSDRLTVSSSNLRGFSNRGIGPKLNNDYIGGNYSFYTTLSTTLPNGLPEKWNATSNIFFDAANVWGVDDGSTNGSNKIRTSAGVGLSWISPIGPISFTYAKPISKVSTDDIEEFNFKIGSAF